MQKAEYDVEQSLLQSSIKKWRASIVQDNQATPSEQLVVQPHTRTCRSSERIKKDFPSVQPRLRR